MEKLHFPFSSFDSLNGDLQKQGYKHICRLNSLPGQANMDDLQKEGLDIENIAIAVGPFNEEHIVVREAAVVNIEEMRLMLSQLFPL
jgi:hypothetical protein